MGLNLYLIVTATRFVSAKTSVFFLIAQGFIDQRHPFIFFYILHFFFIFFSCFLGVRAGSNCSCFVASLTIQHLFSTTARALSIVKWSCIALSRNADRVYCRWVQKERHRARILRGPGEVLCTVQFWGRGGGGEGG